MDDEPVDFLLEMVLHLPRPADLDRCQEILQRIIPSDASADDRRGSLRGLTCLLNFPEGIATASAVLTTGVTGIPRRWAPPEGAPALRAYVPCSGVPRIRAEDLARAICHLFIEVANATGATAGYVDVAGRQEQEPAPEPWVTFQPPQGRIRRMLGARKDRAKMHREEAFPEGLVEGKLGIPPKPRAPVPACIVVAGVVVEEREPDVLPQAEGAGLRVWRVPLAGDEERILVGLLVTRLPLDEAHVEVAPDLLEEFARRASERLARVGISRRAGLFMARVEDAGAA